MIGRISNKALEVVQGRKAPTRPLDPRVGAAKQGAKLRRDWPRAEGTLRAQLPELLEPLRGRMLARPRLDWHERVRRLKSV